MMEMKLSLLHLEGPDFQQRQNLTLATLVTSFRRCITQHEVQEVQICWKSLVSNIEITMWTIEI